MFLKTKFIFDEVCNINSKVIDYRNKHTYHAQRMDSIKIPKNNCYFNSHGKEFL